jgi:hypothetical protein
MAIVTATQKREKEGGEGGERGEKGQCTAQKWKGCVHQATSEQEEHEGVKRGATGGQEGDK